MTKKQKKMSKRIGYLSIGRKRKHVRSWQMVNTAGDDSNIDHQIRNAHMICFICLEKRGTLTSTGRYVCNRCRREHGYS